MDPVIACLALGVLAASLHNSFWWEANIPQVVGRAVGLLSLVVAIVGAGSSRPLLWLATAGFVVSALLGVLGLAVWRRPDKVDQAAAAEARGRARRAR